MIPFITRSCIMIFATIVINIFTSFSNISLFAVMLFLCVWVSARSFENIFLWIIFTAFFYSVLHYDHFGIYFMAIITSAYFFEVAKKQLVRSRYESLFFYYFLSSSITAVISIAIAMVTKVHFILKLESISYAVVGSFLLFFTLYWIISRSERFVDLYAHGADLKCHT